MFGWKWKTYRQILDGMVNGVYLVDLDQKIRFWNRAAESLTGFKADKMIGSSIDGVDFKYEDETGNTIQSFEYPVALCFQEKKAVSKNFFIKTKDNVRIPVEENASPLYSNGKIKGVIATFRDVTRCIRTVESRLKSEKKERLIPICGWCKKIRSDENYWEQLESYLTNEGFGTGNSLKVILQMRVLASLPMVCVLHALIKFLRKRYIWRVIRIYANQ
jgi:PAS domain S-box-containing protein